MTIIKVIEEVYNNVPSLLENKLLFISDNDPRPTISCVLIEKWMSWTYAKNVEELGTYLLFKISVITTLLQPEFKKKRLKKKHDLWNVVVSGDYFYSSSKLYSNRLITYRLSSQTMVLMPLFDFVRISIIFYWTTYSSCCVIISIVTMTMNIKHTYIIFINNQSISCPYTEKLRLMQFTYKESVITILCAQQD